MKRFLTLVSVAASLIAALGVAGVGLYLALGPAGSPTPSPAAGTGTAPEMAAASPPAGAPTPAAAAPAGTVPPEILAPATGGSLAGFVRTIEPATPARDVGGGVAGPPPVGPIVRLTPAPAVVKPADDGARPRRFFRVVVADAGTIHAGRRTLRLAEIEVPSAAAECGDGKGNRWSCGTRARTALRRLVQNRAVECRPAGAEDFAAEALEHIPLRSERSERQEYAQASESGAISDRPGDSVWSEGALAVRCAVGRIDLATWLVENGWAAPAGDAAPALAELGRAARDAGRGLWQVEPVGLDEPEDAPPDDAPEGAAAAAARVLAEEPTEAPPAAPGAGGRAPPAEGAPEMPAVAPRAAPAPAGSPAGAAPPPVRIVAP